MVLKTIEPDRFALIKGVPFPEGERFRQIVVTGPPGSGKTVLVEKLGGWSEEGYLDLQTDWWRSPILSLRPREAHFGFPFDGFEDSLTVFEREWLQAMPPLDLGRVRLPSPKRWFFQTNWLEKYVFDFQLPSAQATFEVRRDRSQRATHHVDESVTLEQVQCQIAVYEALALHLHRHGFRVYARKSFGGNPERIVDPEQSTSAKPG